MHNSPEYSTHEHMKSRCNNPANDEYANYGGRGIKVCERWQVFENFYEDMGPRPEGTSIDRNDNDGNYSCGKCPECLANGWTANCSWATMLKQQSHTRRSRLVTHNGETKHLHAWAREYGISPNTLDHRLRIGWTVEAALTTETTPLFTYNGKTQGYYDWAREIGMRPETLGHRLRAGWPIERALTEPVQTKRKKSDTSSLN